MKAIKTVFLFTLCVWSIKISAVGHMMFDADALIKTPNNTKAPLTSQEVTVLNDQLTRYLNEKIASPKFQRITEIFTDSPCISGEAQNYLSLVALVQDPNGSMLEKLDHLFWNHFIQPHQSNSLDELKKSLDFLDFFIREFLKDPEFYYPYARYVTSKITNPCAQPRFDFYLRDTQGQSIYHWAAEYNHPNLIEFLKDVDSCFDIHINCSDKKGRTPLHLAIINNGCDEAVTELICGGALNQMWDHDGNRPIHLAVGQAIIKSATEKNRLATTRTNQLPLFIISRADIDAPNFKGETPRQLAGQSNIVWQQS